MLFASLFIERAASYRVPVTSAVTVLGTLVTALGAGLGAWGVVNLLEGYGNDNRVTRS